MFQKFPFLETWSLTRRSVTATGLILISYILLGKISLASVFDLHWAANLNSYHPFEYKLDQLLSRGIIGASLGFFLVELLSFVIPPFKQHRVGGHEGRKQLTLWSLGASLLLIIYFAYNQLSILKILVDGSGQPAVPHDGLWQKALLMIASVLCGVLACVMAEGITRFGIGNGFCILFFANALITMPDEFFNIYSEYRKINQAPNLVGIIIALFIGIFLFQKFWPHKNPLFKNIRTPILEGQEGNKPIRFQLPILPQGAVPFLWPESILMWIGSVFISNNFMVRWFSYPSWGYLCAYAALLAGFGYLTYFLIAHPKRIAFNAMGKIKFPEGWEARVHQHALRSIILFALLWFLWNIPSAADDGPYNREYYFHTWITITGVIIFFAILKDVMDQYRFLKEAGNPRILQTFDNVHYVTYLKGLFEAEGIRFCVQAFEYRRLFYFFEPLIKMRVMVDARDWDKANQLADLEKVTII